MTPEEKRVVQAAIDLWRTKPDDPAVIEIANELRIATQALVYACDGCNYDRHLCPGCGHWLPHGDDTCEECANEIEDAPPDASTYPCWECLTDPTEDPRPWCDCRPEDFGSTHPGHACRLRAHPPDRCLNRPEPLAWIARTWRDVREGDRVKMPGASDDTAATVIHAMAHAWHVDPASSQYRPEALEWSAMAVTLLLADGSTRKLNADPAKPVEIELSWAEVTAIEAAGWENRVRIER